MKLYLKANKIIDTKEKIIAILGRFRGETVEVFIQQKLNKIDKENDTPS